MDNNNTTTEQPPATSAPIISPRTYQTELFHIASKQNVLVVLDTGSGKTLISVMLIKSIGEAIRSESELDPSSRSKHLIVFIVDKVPLVAQQAKAIACLTNLRVTQICGDLGVDLWNRQDWEHVFESSDVMVITAQVLYDVLKTGYLSMKDIALMVYDECHHAHSSHPYAVIQQEHYWQAPKEDRPRILGLTASLYSPNGDPFAPFERLLDARVLTVPPSADSHSDLVQAVPKPKEIIIEYTDDRVFGLMGLNLQDQFVARSSGLLEIIRGAKSVFKKIPTAAQYLADALGPWFGDHYIQKSMNAFRSKLQSKLDLMKRDTLLNPLPLTNATPPPPVEQEPNDDEELFVKEFSDMRYREQGRPFTKEELMSLLSITEEASLHYSVMNTTTIANNMMEKYLTKDPSVHTIMSPKLCKLFDIIISYRDRFQAGQAGMVFVGRRATAEALLAFMNAVEYFKPWLKCDYLLGHGTHNELDYKKQTKIVESFRRKSVNLLISTNVGEEGLDIMACSMVIRFDLPKTVQSYIQSRGRARQKDSEYVFLVNKDSVEDYKAIRDFRFQEMDMKTQLASRYVTISVEESDVYEEDWDLKDDECFVVPETGARLTYKNAIQTLQYFLAYLPRDEHMTAYSVTFEFTIEDALTQTFRATSILPPNVPLRARYVHGTIQPNKRAAKQSAAFITVKILFELGLLTNHLTPIVSLITGSAKSSLIKKLNQFRKRKYRIQVPRALQSGIGESVNNVEEELVLYHLYINDHLCPIAILLEDDVSAFPDLFGKTSQENTVIRIERVSGTHGRLVLSSHHTSVLTAFTRCCFAYLDKSDSTKNITFPYLLAPLHPHFRGNKLRQEINEILQNVNCRLDVSCIDWGYLEFVNGFMFNGSFPLISDVLSKSSEWVTKFAIIDTKTHERTYLVESVHDGLKFSELCRKEDADVRVIDDERVEILAKDYNRVLFAESRRKKIAANGINNNIDIHAKRKLEEMDDSELKYVLDDTLPLLKIYVIGQERFYFDTITPLSPSVNSTREPVDNEPRFAHPKFCHLTPLQPDIARILPMIPATLFIIEKTLSTLEFYRSEAINLAIPVTSREVITTLVSSLTSPTAALPFDYERLEILGDAVLKIIQSLYLYMKYPHHNEGVLSMSRNEMESNGWLFKLGVRVVGIGGVVSCEPFRRKKWRPVIIGLNEGTVDISSDSEEEEGIPKAFDFKTETIPTTDSGFHLLHDKKIADTMEAIIGAVFTVTKGDMTATINVINKMFTTEYPSDWSEYAHGHFDITNIPAEKHSTIHGVETSLGYEFKNKCLLLEALTHTSSLSRFPCYQRLEFLGDAILSFMTIQYLYNEFTSLSPSQLTRLRNICVNNDFLAFLVVDKNLHSYLDYFSASLMGNIQTYVPEIIQKRNAYSQLPTTQRFSKISVNGNPVAVGMFWESTRFSQSFNGPHTNTVESESELLPPPKALSDIFESLLAAVFIDSGCDVDVTRRVMMDKILLPWVKDLLEYIVSHPPSNSDETPLRYRLLNLSSSFENGCKGVFYETRYENVSARFVTSVYIHEVLLASARGVTKLEAEVLAAKLALEKIRKVEVGDGENDGNAEERVRKWLQEVVKCDCELV